LIDTFFNLMHAVLVSETL